MVSSETLVEDRQVQIFRSTCFLLNVTNSVTRSCFVIHAEALFKSPCGNGTRIGLLETCEDVLLCIDAHFGSGHRLVYVYSDSERGDAA